MSLPKLYDTVITTPTGNADSNAMADVDADVGPDTDTLDQPMHGIIGLPLCCYITFASLRRKGFVVFRPYSHSIRGVNPIAPKAYDPDEPECEVPLAFEVYESSASFSRTNMGPPAFFVFVARFVPCARQLAVSDKYSVRDNGGPRLRAQVHLTYAQCESGGRASVAMRRRTDQGGGSCR